MRVGIWNLENLFRPGESDSSPTPEVYDAKLTSLAATITGLAPDALAVQEVGSAGALDDLVDRLPGTWKVALADPDQRGIRVGVIATSAVESVQQVSAFPRRLGAVRVADDGLSISAMGRPALRVRVGEVDLVSVHLKSKLLSFPDGRFSPRDEGERARYAVFAVHRRAAEAACVREYADGLLDGDGADRLVVVAGDLNDEPQAATTQILLGPPGSEIGTGGFDTPDAGDGARLWNLAQLIPEEQRWSRVYRGRRELIDHLLVSRAAVLRVTDVATGGPAPQSITDNPMARVDVPGSDHRPVVATLAAP
ncbi:endonuclease/exonuclease/phosphatase family protein [Nocardioides sp. InS609-2]|uniref:endonuclease/exonuclease/phosphatase family protein n=1 Tax=Nocardioides sp. InS609-2 TaxID=2760705 RepID=UPI0020BE000A|nr:endonuclease/exonuclease/phosphatase family protein [Nocardioides sp. InS609-2]